MTPQQKATNLTTGHSLLSPAFLIYHNRETPKLVLHNGAAYLVPSMQLSPVPPRAAPETLVSMG